MDLATSTVWMSHLEEVTVLTPTPRVRIRGFQAGDEDVVETVFAGLSALSRRRRYLAAVDELSPKMLATLRAVDGDRHVAFVAEVGRGRKRRPVGVARYVVDGPDRAEVAYEVVDSWQGRGVGTRLVGALVGAARSRGLEELHATVLPENAASLAVLRRHLPTLRAHLIDGMVEASALLTASPIGAADILADLQLA
jgi:GNAT superfamily N-acetyltransferase